MKDSIDSRDIKIRKSWPKDFQPETKVEKVKTDYKRSNNRKEIEDALAEALDEMQEDKADQYGKYEV